MIAHIKPKLVLAFTHGNDPKRYKGYRWENSVRYKPVTFEAIIVITIYNKYDQVVAITKFAHDSISSNEEGLAIIHASIDQHILGHEYFKKLFP